MKHKKIPWVDRSEQPEHSNDVFPIGFFKSHTLANDTDDEEKATNAFYYNHDSCIEESPTHEG